MAREAVKDIDEMAARLMAQGRLTFRLQGAMVPVLGVDRKHKQAREFGLVWD